MSIRTSRSVNGQRENGRYGNKRSRFLIPPSRTYFECPVCRWKYSTTSPNLPPDCGNCQLDIRKEEWIIGWTKERVLSRSEVTPKTDEQDKPAIV